MENLINKYEKEREHFIEKEKFLQMEIERKKEENLVLQRKLFLSRNKKDIINSFSNHLKINSFSLNPNSPSNKLNKNYSLKNKIFESDEKLLFNKKIFNYKKRGITSFDEKNMIKTKDDYNLNLDLVFSNRLVLKKKTNIIGKLFKKNNVKKFRNNSDLKFISLGNYLNYNSDKDLSKTKNINMRNNSISNLTNKIH